MKYNDIDPRKTAFVFELDDVIYPEKDYLFQVYYLFAGAIEYVILLDAKTIVDFMVNTYNKDGKEVVFDRTKEKFDLDEKYRASFEHLMLTVKLPLKLLVYQAVLDLMQEVVVDRKKLFIITNGNPQQQLNKIKQLEWHGLEAYLTCYFAEETLAKPEPDALYQLIKDHSLQLREIVTIGHSYVDEQFAEACGVDYINIEELL